MPPRAWPAGSVMRLWLHEPGPSGRMDDEMARFLKFPRMHRSRPDDLAGVTGRARLDHRTKNLTTRLCPGEIAIIDHRDLDRVTADALISRQVAAVVNVAPSISGRYPNLGPQLLVEAGIPLVDNVGPDVFTRVAEGETVRLTDEVLRLGDEIVAKGTVQTAETVAAAMTDAKAGVAAQIEAFVINTLEYMKYEGALLIEGIQVRPCARNLRASTLSWRSVATTTARIWWHCVPTSGNSSPS